MVQNNRQFVNTPKLIDKDQTSINLLAWSVLQKDFNNVVDNAQFSYEIIYDSGVSGVINAVVIGKRKPLFLDGSRMLNGSVLLSS